MKHGISKNSVALLFVFIIIALSLVLPVPDGLGRSALYVLGIFISTVLLWMTVGVTWPSVFAILALGFLPETSLGEVISSSIGNSTITFLIFTFCCSWALEQTPFVRRCAVCFLSVPIASRKPWMFILLYFSSILLLGSFMSTTVIVIIYLTINEEIFAILKLQKGNRTADMMTMGLIIVSAISGAVTPIAHVFPLMAISLYTDATGLTIRYLDYILAAVPAGILVMLVMMLIFRIVLKPDVSCLKDLDIEEIRKATPPAGNRERATAAIFLGVCVLWILPELISGILPAVSSFLSSFGTVMPPMLGALLMCLFQVEEKPLMDLKKALAGIPWLSIFMGAAALALGGQVSNPDIGITTAISEAMSPLLAVISPFMFALIMIIFTTLATNVAINMVIVTLSCTIAIPICLSMGNGAICTPALCSVIGMASAYAFATPPAMTTVALGTGSGWTNTRNMAVYGFLVIPVVCLALAFISFPIASAIM